MLIQLVHDSLPPYFTNESERLTGRVQKEGYKKGPKGNIVWLKRPSLHSSLPTTSPPPAIQPRKNRYKIPFFLLLPLLFRNLPVSPHYQVFDVCNVMVRKKKKVYIYLHHLSTSRFYTAPLLVHCCCCCQCHRASCQNFAITSSLKSSAVTTAAR